jgi:phosphatidylglycerol:prolipoprotein diacylglycerol transferase
MNPIALAYPIGIPTDRPVLHFYGLIIVCGACLALFLSNYRAHKDGYDWHFFDSIFLVAFPAGIVGARIWYVIATWPECAPSASEWYRPLAVWEGGLAIQGGAIGGILIGLLYAHYRRKGTPVLAIADYAVPTILIAQAIGRWGNFFNQEVFGHCVLPSAWDFLPSFIVSNMQNGDSAMVSGISLASGSIAAPLFLVEGSINLMFYLIIAHVLPSVLGKHYRLGDTSFSYFIAYGITRLVLEPVRNPAFIMGVTSQSDLSKSNAKSFIMAIVFIVFGVLAVVSNHVIQALLEKKKKATPALATSVAAPVVAKKEETVDLAKLRAKEEALKNSDTTDDKKS